VGVQQKFTMDTAYYILRELMNTERTYKKDLEVIAVVSLCVLYIYVRCNAENTQQLFLTCH